MIAGVVNEFLEATVDLTVRGPGGREERLEFVVDTGFAGNISLHSAVAAALELPFVGVASVRLADGRVIPSAICEAQLLWNGTVREVWVDIADNVPMLGMRMLAGHGVQMHVVPEGEVRISPLPRLDLDPGPG